MGRSDWGFGKSTCRPLESQKAEVEGVKVKGNTVTNPRRSLLVRCLGLLMFAVGSLALYGCESFPVRQANHTPTIYKEEWTVRTEPAGCKIYINDEYNGEYNGDSPLVTSVTGGEVLVSDFLGQNESFTPKHKGGWTIKACKEGYESATRVVVCGDDVLARTFENEKVNTKWYWWPNPWSFAPPVITGKRSILLELRPPSLAQNSNVTSFANTNGQGAVGGRTVDEAARIEYEQAMAGYKQTLEQRNFSRLGANAAVVSNTLPGGNPKFNAVNGLAQQFAVDNSDKDVEIARQRLERAKARINHTELPQ